MQSSFQNRCQVFARCGFALLLFQCCGCAYLAVVKTKPAQLPGTVVPEGPLESAKRYLVVAEHEQPLAALGHDLLAARISYGVLERHPKNKSGRSIYNFAVARVVHDVDRTNLEPWRHPVTVLTDQGRYTLASPKPYHSIIGDRGRGDTPNGSNGVVPYWSSHLQGAQSELIVDSDHGAQYNPQAIREVERILKTHP